MGFLDRLANIIGSEIVNEVVDNTLGKRNVTTTNNYNPVNQNVMNTNNLMRTGNELKEYFYSILTSEFSEYEIKRDVATTEYGTTSYNKAPAALSFCLYKDGLIKATIMITPHSKERTYPYLGAKEICTNAGITYINFFEHFPNERDYVINRIKSFLA